MTDYGFESEEALINQYGEDYVKNAYVSDKTMELLINNAKITYDEKKDAADQEKSEQNKDDSANDSKKKKEKAE